MEKYSNKRRKRKHPKHLEKRPQQTKPPHLQKKKSLNKSLSTLVLPIQNIEFVVLED
jgi:hypothetical protein